ncbi:hypothetical protein M408DRAFT_23026 [Serendipita vermifera MAFF 305830]|uniref:Uncharacterized protein n=1 Tax=Serendipita vermifera MAFF 305830 TaxID=933852 RepID=A0A0C3BCQ5_SERVB|nr:hypothetical protein M408DRAFT_23026 [Serendipita vermifera MAFF 305830]
MDTKTLEPPPGNPSPHHSFEVFSVAGGCKELIPVAHVLVEQEDDFIPILHLQQPELFNSGHNTEIEHSAAAVDMFKHSQMHSCVPSEEKVESSSNAPSAQVPIGRDSLALIQVYAIRKMSK